MIRNPAVKGDGCILVFTQLQSIDGPSSKSTEVTTNPLVIKATYGYIRAVRIGHVSGHGLTEV